MVLSSFIFPLAALADITDQQVVLNSGQSLNLDTGATASAGGDLLYTAGVSLTPQGKATAFSLGAAGQAAYAQLTQQALAQFGPAYTAAPIPNAALVVNLVIAVHTNGGNYAKLLITAVGKASINVQFTTFGAAGGGGGGGGPTITKIQNNYSFLLQGVPNYGIAPGSLFIVVGISLSDPVTPVLQSSAAPGLPLTLNKTSLTATVNGVVTHPALYYTSATQLAAVLPSNTPVGTGTLTATYNGQTSAPFTLVVVASAMGLDALYGTGSGLAVATDNNTGALFGYTHSIDLGQVVVLWGSGVGADTANDDRTFPMKQDNLNNISALYVGGIQAQILYQGRSQYPGVDQIDIIVPRGVTPGCFVSVVAVSGTGSTAVVSNTVTIAVNPGGGVCSDPDIGLNGNQLVSFGGQTSLRTGSLSLGQFTDLSAGGQISTFTSASGVFQSTQGAFYGSGYGLASTGNCIILAPLPQGSTSPFQTTGLDAGPSITVNGPAGSVQMPQLQSTKGFYTPSSLLAASFIPASGGTFMFNNGNGGADVKGFNATLNYPTPPLMWTDMATITSVQRSQGVTVHWTGGAANTDVLIEGSSTSGMLSVTFICRAPVSAMQFTVPSYITLALPAGNGSLDLFNGSVPQTFTAIGIDVGFASSSTGFSRTETYN